MALTRKQAWLKVHHRKRVNFDTLDEGKAGLARASTSALTGLSDLTGARCGRSQSWPRTTDNPSRVLPNLSPHGPGKHVTFDRTVSVLLVPSRRDYDGATTARVWWTFEDIFAFRKNAFEFYKRYGSLSVQEGEGGTSTAAVGAAASPAAASGAAADASSSLVNPDLGATRRASAVEPSKGLSRAEKGSGGSVPPGKSAVAMPLPPLAPSNSASAAAPLMVVG